MSKSSEVPFHLGTEPTNNWPNEFHHEEEEQHNQEFAVTAGGGRQSISDFDLDQAAEAYLYFEEHNIGSGAQIGQAIDVNRSSAHNLSSQIQPAHTKLAMSMSFSSDSGCSTTSYMNEDTDDQYCSVTLMLNGNTPNLMVAETHSLDPNKAPVMNGANGTIVSTNLAQYLATFDPNTTLSHSSRQASMGMEGSGEPVFNPNDLNSIDPSLFDQISSSQLVSELHQDDLNHSFAQSPANHTFRLHHSTTPVAHDGRELVYSVVPAPTVIPDPPDIQAQPILNQTLADSALRQRRDSNASVLSLGSSGAVQDPFMMNRRKRKQILAPIPEQQSQVSNGANAEPPDELERVNKLKRCLANDNTPPLVHKKSFVLPQRGAPVRLVQAVRHLHPIQQPKTTFDRSTGLPPSKSCLSLAGCVQHHEPTVPEHGFITFMPERPEDVLAGGLVPLSIISYKGPIGYQIPPKDMPDAVINEHAFRSKRRTKIGSDEWKQIDFSTFNAEYNIKSELFDGKYMRALVYTMHNEKYLYFPDSGHIEKCRAHSEILPKQGFLHDQSLKNKPPMGLQVLCHLPDDTSYSQMRAELYCSRPRPQLDVQYLGDHESGRSIVKLNKAVRLNDL